MHITQLLFLALQDIAKSKMGFWAVLRLSTGFRRGIWSYMSGVRCHGTQVATREDATSAYPCY